LPLAIDQRQVFRVGFRDEQGYVGFHAMRARVRHDVRPRARELLLDRPSHLGVEG
jgi:hypothetical protein